MEHNDLEMFGYALTFDISELIALLKRKHMIETTSREYEILEEAIKTIEKLTGFIEENKNDIRLYFRD